MSSNGSFESANSCPPNRNGQANNDGLLGITADNQASLIRGNQVQNFNTSYPNITSMPSAMEKMSQNRNISTPLVVDYQKTQTGNTNRNSVSDLLQPSHMPNSNNQDSLNTNLGNSFNFHHNATTNETFSSLQSGAENSGFGNEGNFSTSMFVGRNQNQFGQSQSMSRKGGASTSFSENTNTFVPPTSYRSRNQDVLSLNKPGMSASHTNNPMKRIWLGDNDGTSNDQEYGSRNSSRSNGKNSRSRGQQEVIGAHGQDPVDKFNQRMNSNSTFSGNAQFPGNSESANLRRGDQMLGMLSGFNSSFSMQSHSQQHSKGQDNQQNPIGTNIPGRGGQMGHTKSQAFEQNDQRFSSMNEPNHMQKNSQVSAYQDSFGRFDDDFSTSNGPSNQAAFEASDKEEWKINYPDFTRRSRTFEQFSNETPDPAMETSSSFGNAAVGKRKYDDHTSSSTNASNRHFETRTKNTESTQAKLPRSIKSSDSHQFSKTSQDQNKMNAELAQGQAFQRPCDDSMFPEVSRREIADQGSTQIKNNSSKGAREKDEDPVKQKKSEKQKIGFDPGAKLSFNLAMEDDDKFFTGKKNNPLRTVKKSGEKSTLPAARTSDQNEERKAREEEPNHDEAPSSTAEASEPPKAPNNPLSFLSQTPSIYNGLMGSSMDPFFMQKSTEKLNKVVNSINKSNKDHSEEFGNYAPIARDEATGTREDWKGENISGDFNRQMMPRQRDRFEEEEDTFNNIWGKSREKSSSRETQDCNNFNSSQRGRDEPKPQSLFATIYTEKDVSSFMSPDVLYGSQKSDYDSSRSKSSSREQRSSQGRKSRDSSFSRREDKSYNSSSRDSKSNSGQYRNGGGNFSRGGQNPFNSRDNGSGGYPGPTMGRGGSMFGGSTNNRFVGGNSNGNGRDGGNGGNMSKNRDSNRRGQTNRGRGRGRW